MLDEETTAPPDDGKVAITLDGREMRVAKGTLVLDAATEAGVHIPIYCAHPKMEPVAVCRMCLVHIEKAPKLQPACATHVAEGMVVDTQRADVAKTREGMLEFLLLNHPLDCPVCDRGGECDLQDFAVRYGPGTSRFPITEKVHANKAVQLSEKIELDQERCILCWRCTRYYDEITGEKELVLQHRGTETVIDTFNNQSLRSEFQGNLPEICPVGALTHRQYRFRARPWDLQRTKSVCPECSYGCNINTDTRDFEVKRFASRDNPDVDDMWLCDRGRYSAESWNSVDRVRRAAVRPRRGEARDVSTDEAIREAAAELVAIKKAHGADAIGVMGSAENTNEELWLLQRLAREVLGTANLDHQLEVFADLNPAEHDLGIADIEKCSHVFVLGDQPELEAPVLRLRLFKAQRQGVKVIRVATDAAAYSLGEGVENARLVGVIADETNRGRAAAAVTAIRPIAEQVARLTVTRGVNGRGAKDMGMLPALAAGYRPAQQVGVGGRAMLEAAAAGTIRALLLVGMEATLRADPELTERALAKADRVIAIETRPGLIATHATVLIPGHAFFEKAGTVTNVEGRVQRIRQALPPATQTPSETSVLTVLAKELGVEWASGDPLVIHREMASAIPEYAAAGNGGRARFDSVTTP